MKFQILSALVLAALTHAVPAVPAGLVSVAAMKEWIRTTDVNLTFTGLPIEDLGINNPFITTVTYCSTVTFNLCSGPCTVFTGSGVCLSAPNTNCLAATTDVAFCANSGCTDCHTLGACGTRLANGFCSTPSTKSISIPN